MRQNVLWLTYVISILIQLIEGWIWYKNGNYDLATTQLRLSSVLSSIIICIGAFLYIEKDRDSKEYIGLLWYLVIWIGNNSFGIYLCHMLVWRVINKVVPEVNVFPISTVLVIVGSLAFVNVGHRITGKYAYLFGL
ncbi:acyltransferase family protein [Blautia sp.]